VIDLGDRMALRRRAAPSASASSPPSDTLRCSDPTVPSDGRNLVIKALDLYRRKAFAPGTRPEDLPWFDVDLEKFVPHGAGLGGGSGNAATALWAANELCGRRATDADLLAWSGEIGSDISVFFGPTGAAYCTGRGEVVEPVGGGEECGGAAGAVGPMPLPLDTPLLLVKPPVGLSTPAIFKALDLGRRSTRDPRDLLTAVSAGGVAKLQQAAVNDLEQPAFDCLPELGAMKARLAGREGDGSGRPFDAVFMTGSGSTVVCVGSDAPPAWLAAEGWRSAGGVGGGAAVPSSVSVEDEEPLFVSPARLIARDRASDGRRMWYTPSASGEAARAAWREAQQKQQTKQAAAGARR
jgi:4-diphosphocytidyl-2-C-methyl-D-erythritol kinase